jgi:hypothetical protein
MTAYQSFRRSFVVFSAILVVALLTFANEELFTADARMATAKAVTSNSDNLYNTGQPLSMQKMEHIPWRASVRLSR